MSDILEEFSELKGLGVKGLNNLPLIISKDRKSHNIPNLFNYIRYCVLS